MAAAAESSISALAMSSNEKVRAAAVSGVGLDMRSSRAARSSQRASANPAAVRCSSFFSSFFA